jgi:excinuclease ABC subunit A
VVASRIGSRTAEGTPKDVAKVKESYTGRYLKDLLGRRSANGRGENQAAE